MNEGVCTGVKNWFERWFVGGYCRGQFRMWLLVSSPAPRRLQPSAPPPLRPPCMHTQVCHTRRNNGLARLDYY